MSLVHLPPGVHKYSFRLFIPKNAPSSFGFKSEYLSSGIHHLAKVILVRPSHKDVIHIEPFTVVNLNIADLNKDSTAKVSFFIFFYIYSIYITIHVTDRKEHKG